MQLAESIAAMNRAGILSNAEAKGRREHCLFAVKRIKGTSSQNESRSHVQDV
jgi:hypothetical protein